jgi:hypothetical protein
LRAVSNVAFGFFQSLKYTNLPLSADFSSDGNMCSHKSTASAVIQLLSIKPSMRFRYE